MIPRELEAEILRLFHAEKWRIGTIGREVGVHHSTVRRVLSDAGVPAARLPLRPSIADPFVPFIVETLEKYPRLRASRLYEMVRERGYPGRPDHFRSVVARHRPRLPAEAYLRLRTLPGEQAQVDWAHFGKITVGRAERVLWGFVMVLSFSRQIFLRFFFGAAMTSFVRGHVEAFEAFQGVARVLLYDNLKSAVLERRRDAIRFHPTLLELAAHYRFLPRPVAVARGNQKGRVERAIRYARENFFAARPWNDLDDLNAQARQWCLTTAAERPCPEERTRNVGKVFLEEKSRLLALPPNPFPVEERVEVAAGRTPYIRFDLNDYSVPPDCVQRALVVLATEKQVRIADGMRVLAVHVRSFDRGQQIEDPAHVQALVDFKRQAREHRGLDRLHHAAPASHRLFAEAALRGTNLGSLTRGLLSCLDAYGAAALGEAIVEALEADSPHLGAVRRILERRRSELGKPPPLAVALPAHRPELRDLVVHPHTLEAYDRLQPQIPDATNSRPVPNDPSEPKS
jgi:transposase